jgi:hypothetical protein
MDRDERASPAQRRMRRIRLRRCPVQRREDMEYRYPHFKRSLLLEDTSFHGGVAPAISWQTSICKRQMGAASAKATLSVGARCC